MNPQLEVDNPGPSITALESPTQATDQAKPERRSRSKIAQLPKPLRNLIDSMLDDGAPYGLIIEKLQQSKDPPLPYPISEMNLSRWYDTGYQRHLALQERLAEVRANREAALDLVTGDDTTTLPEATLQIIASQYYDVLGDFSPASLKKKLLEDPLKYTRFLSVFARLTREIVNLKKHREDAAKAVAAELKHLDPSRELSDREHQIITDRMDDFFLKPRRRRPNPDPPAAPPNPSNPPIADH